MLIVTLVIAVIIVFLISRNFTLSEGKGWSIFVVWGCMYAFLQWSTKTVIYINPDRSKEELSFWGNPTIVSSSGDTVIFDDMKLFSTYLVNFLDEDLIVYPVVYGDNADHVKLNDDDFHFLGAYQYCKLKNKPDFYFEAPSSINVSEYWFERLFKAITSSDYEIKYVLDRYDWVAKKFGWED